MKGHPRTDELLAPLKRAIDAVCLTKEVAAALHARAWGVVFRLCLEAEEARRGEVAGAVLAERLNRDLAETRAELERAQVAARTLQDVATSTARVRDAALRDLAGARAERDTLQAQLDAAGARLVTASRERDAARDNFLGARDERDRLWLELKKLGVVRSDAEVQAVSDAVRAATRSAG